MEDGNNFVDNLLHVCVKFPLFQDFSHEATTDPSSFRDSIRLAPMPDSFDLDRGLLLAVQAIQVRSKGLEICSVSYLLKITITQDIHIYVFDGIIFAYLSLFQALLENKGVPVIVGIGNMDIS